jgi:hypothetical protein
VLLTFSLAETADPAGSWIVFPVPPEHAMDLIDQEQSEFHVFFFARSTM